MSQPQTFVIKRTLLQIVSQAQRDGAGEIMMGEAPEGGTAIKYKVNNTWYDWAPAPGLSWPVAVSELGGLAGIRHAPHPKTGILYLAYSGLRLRWQVQMTGANSTCLLRDLGLKSI